MTEEEMQELVQNALQKTLKEIKENPSNVFNYLELQKRYNGVLKDKVKLQQDNKKLNKQLENCYCNRTDCSSRIKDSKRYDSLVQKYDKALMILANFWPPCEQDDFMDKNTDYCSINCGVDEEVFKKCWDKYIEQCLKEVE